MNVFDCMKTVPYAYYKAARGTVHGNSLGQAMQSTGVFKLRRGQNAPNTAEADNGQPTLHVRANEPFIVGGQSVVGDVVEVNNRKFEIIGQTKGKNFDSGAVEHYTLTLAEADL